LHTAYGHTEGLSFTVHALSTRASHLSVLLQTVADKLVDQMDEPLKADVMYWAAFYERRMRVGNKKIFHLEAWVVKVMSLSKVMYTSNPLVQERWEGCWIPTSPWSFGPEGHPFGRRLTDYLHFVPLQHYLFDVEMDDLTAFD